jgi:polyisoprenoid-binding protein YceI
LKRKLVSPFTRLRQGAPPPRAGPPAGDWVNRPCHAVCSLGKYRRRNYRPLANLFASEASLVMKSYRALLIFGFCLFAAVSSAQTNDVYKIDAAKSKIEFQVGNFLGTAKGRFTMFSGTIEVDPDHPEKSSVTVTIQATSINTANAKRDEHLRTADFFDVKKFPEITFKSRRVKQTGSNAGEVAGELTMHGVTRPTALHVQLLGSAASIGKDPTSKWRVTTEPISRTEFGIGMGGMASMIGKDVRVEIEIQAERK